MSYKIFAINPGSTTTKIAMFQDGQALFTENVSGDEQVLAAFPGIAEQYDYRRETILEALARRGVGLADVDAFVGRGGGMMSVEGGIYLVNDLMIEHNLAEFSVKHPANLGPKLAKSFGDEYGKLSCVVNPPDTDEFIESARYTGWKGVYRESKLHALNQKEVGRRFAAARGVSYEDLNLIICHIGGGLSVTAHRHGRMIDSNDIAQGDGPMAPTRGGAIPVKDVINLCFGGEFSERRLKERMTKNGGLLEHLGTNDAREIVARIKAGDGYAKAIYDAMLYQTAKFAGGMAVALGGRVDGVILTGGLSRDGYLTERLTDYLSFLAPVTVMAGEFEMEALAAGALRVLRGEEQPREYTGVPVWQGRER